MHDPDQPRISRIEVDGVDVLPWQVSVQLLGEDATVSETLKRVETVEESETRHYIISTSSVYRSG